MAGKKENPPYQATKRITARLERRDDLARKSIGLALDIMRVLGDPDDEPEYADHLALQMAISERFRLLGCAEMRQMRYRPGDDKGDRIEFNAACDEATDLVLKYWAKAWEDDPHAEQLTKGKKRGKV